MSKYRLVKVVRVFDCVCMAIVTVVVVKCREIALIVKHYLVSILDRRVRLFLVPLWSTCQQIDLIFSCLYLIEFSHFCAEYCESGTNSIQKACSISKGKYEYQI